MILEAHDLHKRFGDVTAVDGVSLDVAAHEAYGLVGPDGAGKTTTMRLLVGALTADAGDVVIAGDSVQRRVESARAHVGYLAQRFSLYGELTVMENLRFFGEVRSMPHADVTARAEELLEFVGLAGFERRQAEQLSGGMKQKLGLACALIHRPRVLLLDEPSTGVDPVTRQGFWQLIIRLLHEGVAVVVTTPYMDEAVRCNRIGFMYQGRILLEGPPRRLTERLAGRVLELAGEPKRRARDICRADPDVEDVVAFGDRLHLRVRDAEQVLERLPAALAAGGVTVAYLRAVTPSLEDVFISLLEDMEAHNA